MRRQLNSFECQLGKPRRLQRGLDVHLKINHVGYELGVRLGLVPSAHDSKADPNIAFLEEGRNDGVQGTLARLERVGVLRIEAEQRAPVLQAKASARCHQSRAETAVVTLNQGDDVALFVDRRHVDGVGAWFGLDVLGRAGSGGCQHAIPTDLSPPLFPPSLPETPPTRTLTATR